jgi:hypothetical protein
MNILFDKNYIIYYNIFSLILIRSIKMNNTKLFRDQGCGEDCIYTDPKALREGKACCIYPGKLFFDPKNMKCLTKRSI